MKILAMIISLVAATPVFASSLPELTQYFSDSIASTDQAVNQCIEFPNASDEKSEIWYYRRFWLRIRPKATFTIPMIAKLEIVPELEMLWQR